jgi:hypothetical protein
MIWDCYIHLESDSKTSTQRHRKWLASSHPKLQGTIEVQTVQGAMEVVKRLETWAEAVGVTFCRGWSVCGRQRSAIALQYRLRCITSRCTGTDRNAIVYDTKRVAVR